MTAQIPDQIEFRGTTFAIAGVNGGKLFDPLDHELQPVACCSACWRGFFCRYAVTTGQLFLEELHINLGRGEQLRMHYAQNFPTLFGVQSQPTKDDPVRLFNAVFADVHHPISYTGGLLLADDFINDLYVHMGFHPAWKFRNVYELIVREGELVEAADRSEQVAQFREGIATSELEPNHDATRREIEDWISKCFTQIYGW